MLPKGQGKNSDDHQHSLLAAETPCSPVSCSSSCHWAPNPPPSNPRPKSSEHLVCHWAILDIASSSSSEPGFKQRTTCKWIIQRFDPVRFQNLPGVCTCCIGYLSQHRTHLGSKEEGHCCTADAVRSHEVAHLQLEYTGYDLRSIFRPVFCCTRQSMVDHIRSSAIKVSM